MSYGIEYQSLTFQFDACPANRAINELGRQQGKESFFPDYGSCPAYVAFLEHGSNNCYDESGKRARQWGVQHIGDHGQVMGRIIRASEYVESGMTKPKDRGQRAETYIATNRKRLAEALPLTVLQKHLQGRTIALGVQDFSVDQAANHPWWVMANEKGWVFSQRYYAAGSAVKFYVADALTLEMALMAVSQVSVGDTVTMANLIEPFGFESVLKRLCPGEQLRLIA